MTVLQQQFDALCEGIAWMELRGNPLDPDPERFWHAFTALGTGSLRVPRPPQTARAPSYDATSRRK